MTTVKTKLAVGQQLYFVPTDQRDGKPRFVTVTNIGRKRATLKTHGRVNLETLVMAGDGYPSPGRCYLSEADYLRQMAAKEAWNALAGAIRWNNPPAGITIEDIRQATELLRLAQPW